jgi:hypothetical protein
MLLAYHLRYALYAASIIDCSAVASAIACVQGVIGVLLNGCMDLSAMPRVPLRPTHSRHGSFHELPDVSCSSSGGGAAAAALAAVGAAAYQSSSQPGSPMSAAYSPLAQVGTQQSSCMSRLGQFIGMN